MSWKASSAVMVVARGGAVPRRFVLRFFFGENEHSWNCAVNFDIEDLLARMISVPHFCVFVVVCVAGDSGGPYG